MQKKYRNLSEEEKEVKRIQKKQTQKQIDKIVISDKFKHNDKGF